MIMKVKEPLPDEYELMRENQILYTYLHLAAEPKLTKVLAETKSESGRLRNYRISIIVHFHY
jgi:alanine dehydrogenase